MVWLTGFVGIAKCLFVSLTIILKMADGITMFIK